MVNLTFLTFIKKYLSGVSSPLWFLKKRQVVQHTGPEEDRTGIRWIESIDLDNTPREREWISSFEDIGLGDGLVSVRQLGYSIKMFDGQTISDEEDLELTSQAVLQLEESIKSLVRGNSKKMEYSGIYFDSNFVGFGSAGPNVFLHILAQEKSDAIYWVAKIHWNEAVETSNDSKIFLSIYIPIYRKASVVPTWRYPVLSEKLQGGYQDIEANQ